VRPRTLLATLPLIAAAVLPFAPVPAPNAPAEPAADTSPFTDIDLRAIPQRPFACFALKLPRQRGQERCGIGSGGQLILSPDLGYLTATRGVAGVSDGAGCRWDILGGGRVAGLMSELPPSYQENWHRSADGRVYANSTYGDNKPSTSRLFAPHLPAEGEPLLPEVTDRSVWPLAVSPDGRLLYLADGREVRVWSTETVQPMRTLFPIATEEGHDPQGYEVIPSPDGRRVAVFADEELKVTFRFVRRCGLDVGPTPYQPSGGRKRLTILDTSTWATTHEFVLDGWATHWWADDDCLASQDPRSATSGERAYRTTLRHLNSGRVEEHAFRVNWDYADNYFNSTNRERRWQAAWGSANYGPADTVTLFDLFNRRRTRVLRVRQKIDRTEFTPDTRVLIVLHPDDTVRLYDLCGATRPPADYAVGRLWADLASEHPLTVYRAARWAVEHPAEAVPLLARELEGRTAVSAERLKRWIDDLSDPQFPTRHAATLRLGEHLDVARPLLEGGTTTTAEAEARRADLLARPDPITPETRRSRWAVFALEQIDSAETRAVLRDWASRPRPFGLTAEAKDALKRVGNR
jgi:hypothetical protein